MAKPLPCTSYKWKRNKRSLYCKNPPRIGGKVERNGAESEVEFVNDYADADPLKSPFKRLDGGANFLAGYEFANKLSFQLNAQLGLLNIAPDGANDNKVKNTGFGLSLGYRF